MLIVLGVNKSQQVRMRHAHHAHVRAAADAIDAINGDLKNDLAQSVFGGVTYNHFGRVALDMVASQTDIKPFWDYRTYNVKFDAQAQIANKLASAWWSGRHISLRFADVIKLALPIGTAYAHQTYDAFNNGFGGGYQGGDIDMIAEDDRVTIRTRVTGTNSGGAFWFGAPANDRNIDFRELSSVHDVMITEPQRVADVILEVRG